MGIGHDHSAHPWLMLARDSGCCCGHRYLCTWELASAPPSATTHLSMVSPPPCCLGCSNLQTDAALGQPYGKESKFPKCLNHKHRDLIPVTVEINALVSDPYRSTFLPLNRAVRGGLGCRTGGEKNVVCPLGVGAGAHLVSRVSCLSVWLRATFLRSMWIPGILRGYHGNCFPL